MGWVRIFVLGDTHGNTAWVTDYVYPRAAACGADAIVQLGDFGYWEHTPDGIQYLDTLADCAATYHIPLYWLHGNHDKHSLAVEKYAANLTVDGFAWCRPGINYILNGHVWEWAGVRMRAFGGAYSVDKDFRLKKEAARRKKIEYQNGYRARAGRPLLNPDTTGTLWFPEEEMSDTDMDTLLVADSSPLAVVFSHDKPRSAHPGWNRKDFEECLPNQDRLQHALVTHQPEMWFHGHLHYRYETMVRSGDDDTFTRVVGLGPDRDAAPPRWRPTDAWCLLDLDDSRSLTLTSAEEAVCAQKQKLEWIT